MNGRWVLLIVLVLTLIVGAHGSKAEETFERYVSQEKGFSIDLPQGWERKENFMEAVVFAISPQEGFSDPFREDFNVMVDDLGGASLEQYFQISVSNIKDLVGPSYQEYEKGTARLDNREARRLICSYVLNNKHLKSVLYMTKKDGRGYTLTCSASIDQFDRYQDTFERVAQSLKLE